MLVSNTIIKNDGIYVAHICHPSSLYPPSLSLPALQVTGAGAKPARRSFPAAREGVTGVDAHPLCFLSLPALCLPFPSPLSLTCG